MVMIDTFEANTIAMHRRLGESRISLRPHIKVHRVPALGRMQVSAGAAGIACQTLDEVETMVAAGFREILLTNSLVDSKKLSRFMELQARTALAITAESDEAIEKLSRVAVICGRKAPVYVECDIGGARTGFADPSRARRSPKRSPNRRSSSLPGLPLTWVAIRSVPISTEAKLFWQRSYPDWPALESMSLR